MSKEIHFSQQNQKGVIFIICYLFQPMCCKYFFFFSLFLEQAARNLIIICPSVSDILCNFLQTVWLVGKLKSPRFLRYLREEMSIAGLPKKEANVLQGHEGAVLAARFNGDGNYCLSCGKDRTIRLWNPHRGIHIKTYKSHGREVRDVHVAP